MRCRIAKLIWSTSQKRAFTKRKVARHGTYAMAAQQSCTVEIFSTRFQACQTMLAT